MAYHGKSNGVYAVMTGILILFALFTYPLVGFSLLGLGAAIILWLVASNWESSKRIFGYALMVSIIVIWAVSCARGVTGY